MKRKQLFQLIMIQFMEFYREPGVLFWAFGFPILMAWGLGIAFKQKPDVIRKVSVIENSVQANDTDKLYKFLKNETKEYPVEKDGTHRHIMQITDAKIGKTIYVFISSDWDQALLQLKRGNVSLIINGDSGKVKYHFDPVNPEARLVQLQLQALINGENKFENSPDVVPMTLTGTRYIDFLIPGLIAMGVMMSCMWGISWSIIDNRSKKLLRRMVATPMRRSNYLISLFIARLILGTIEAAMIYIFAYYYFNMHIQGSFIALFMIFIAGNIAFTGVAILSASRTAKPEVGNGIINAITSPMLVLSGVFFSYHNFPDWCIPFIKKLPLTMLADSMRSIFNEGAGFSQMIVPMLGLTFLGLATFVLGLKIYKWY